MVEYEVSCFLFRTKRQFHKACLGDERYLISIYGEARLGSGNRVGTDEVGMLLRQFLAGVLNQIFRFHRETYEDLLLLLMFSEPS